MKPSEIKARNVLKYSKPLVYDKVIKFDEKHARGEPTPIVRIEYSYACNFRCNHCSIHDLQAVKRQRILTPKDVADISRQADELGLAQMVLSGGEPLVYPDFDEVIEAMNPEKFYITTDSNGWNLDDQRANHLKVIGVDKVQISVDSLIPADHDNFRNKQGSWRRAVDAVKYCQDAGLKVLIQTVVDKQRVHSRELTTFIMYFNAMDVPVYIGYAKPVGAWKGKEDLIDQDDIDYIQVLEKDYDVFTHLTPAYGYEGGCIAVKRMINITKWGDVNPCPFMQEINLGNIFNEPLSDIIDRGMGKFGEHIPTCPMATDKDFVKKYKRE